MVRINLWLALLALFFGYQVSWADTEKPKNADEGFLYDNNRAALNPIVSISDINTKVEVYLPSQDGKEASAPDDWNIDLYYKPVMIFDIFDLEQQYNDNCSTEKPQEIHYFSFKFYFPDLSPTIGNFIFENYKTKISRAALASTALTPPYRAFDIGYEIQTEGKQDYLVIESKGSISDPYTDLNRVIAPVINSKEHLISCIRVRTLIDAAAAGRDVFWAKLYGYTNTLNKVEEVAVTFGSSITETIKKKIEETDANSKIVNVLTSEKIEMSDVTTGIQLTGGLKVPLAVDASGSFVDSDKSQTQITDKSGSFSSVNGSRLVTGSYLNEIKQATIKNASIVFRNYPETDRQNIIDLIWQDLVGEFFIEVDPSFLEITRSGSILTVKGDAINGKQMQYDLGPDRLASELNKPSDSKLYWISDSSNIELSNIQISNVSFDFSNKPASIDLDYSVELSRSLLKERSSAAGLGVGEFDYAAKRRAEIDTILSSARLERNRLADELGEKLTALEDALELVSARAEAILAGELGAAEQKMKITMNESISNFESSLVNVSALATEQINTSLAEQKSELQKEDAAVQIKLAARLSEIESSYRSVEQLLTSAADLAGDLGGSFVVPVGTVIWWNPTFTGQTVPQGWAVADGRKVTLSTGETIFTPDLLGKGVIGGQDSIGEIIGSNTVMIDGKSGATSLTIAQMPRHSHEIGHDGRLNAGVESKIVWPRHTVDVRLPRNDPPQRQMRTEYAGKGRSHDHKIQFSFDNRAESVVLIPLMKL